MLIFVFAKDKSRSICKVVKLSGSKCYSIMDELDNIETLSSITPLCGLNV